MFNNGLILKMLDMYDGTGGYYQDPNLAYQASGQGLWGNVAAGALSGAASGSVVPGWGTLIGGVVGAGTALIEGESQKSKAKKLLAAQRPTQNVPQAVLENQEIAKQKATQGLPAAQYDLAMKNIQRQSNEAVANAQSRRAGIGLIPAIQQQQNDAQASLDAQNAAARNANIKTLMGVNNTVGGYQQQNFDWNQKQKYLQNYNYGMQLLGAGNQNIVGGIDRATAGLMRSGAFNQLFAARPSTAGQVDNVSPTPYAQNMGSYVAPSLDNSIGTNIPSPAANYPSIGGDLGTGDFQITNGE